MEIFRAIDENLKFGHNTLDCRARFFELLLHLGQKKSSHARRVVIRRFCLHENTAR